MELPANVADPLFMGELCESLGKTLSELGREASNWEVCVFWPAYYSAKNRIAKREAERQEGR